MIVGNKKEIKIQLYDADGGGNGGDLEIDWKPGEMSTAAADYLKAKESYLSALAEITKALGDLSGAWTGSAATAWTTETGQLLTKLNKIGDTLSANSTNLGKISSKFAEIENEMKTNVTNIVS